MQAIAFVVNAIPINFKSLQSKKIKSFYGKQGFNIQTKTEHLKRLCTIRKFYGNNFFKIKK